VKDHFDLGRWPEADELLDKALALPPEQREGFIRRATAHDRALGYALASIVREASREDGFLEPGGALTGDLGDEVGRALEALPPTGLILTPGNSVEHYEVIELLGRGGMGEVYRARDRRLNREVALKVLLPQFAQDPDRLARFRREAQVLAAINHPGIAAIYGLAEQDSVRALVLEYLEGVTLAERLESGPLSVTQSVAIARQLAEAIEAAHHAGVIHRDLKPANIILVRERAGPHGAELLVAKVLDFGLGKALTPVQDDTALHGLTGKSPGLLLGTAAYMSPEQVRADAVDERADIWAFGCVVFEMLTGTRAFPGRTAAEVLANIVEREPAFGLLPVDTPPSIRRLLRRTLEKHLGRRLADIRDAILELDDATMPAVEAPSSRRGPLLAIAALIAAAAVGAALWPTFRRAERAAEPVARFSVALPSGDVPTLGFQPVAALSPDGRTLVYAARRGDTTALFRRDLAVLEPELIAGTSGGKAPFFSPDGRWLGFAAGGELRRMPLAGGPVEPIVAASGDVTAAWTADDAVIFSTTATRVLHRVPVGGGAPATLTTLDRARGDTLHLLPQPLPGNSALLFTIVAGTDRHVAALRRETGEISIITSGTHGRYLPTGHLLFWRDNTLLMMPFDVNALRVTGEAVPVMDDVAHTGDQVVHLDVAADGSMAFLPGGDYESTVRRLTWIDRAGRQTAANFEARPFVGVAISPDASRFAFAIDEHGNSDIWIAAPSLQTMTQLTAEPANETMPAWTPDGRYVTFQSDRGGTDIYRRDFQGETPIQRLTLQGGAIEGPHSLAPDGRVLFAARSSITSVVPPSTEAQTLIESSRPLLDPQVSPDGRYLAYCADESGRYEIYVTPYPPQAGRRWRVSAAGGAAPRWRRDSRELLFLDGGGLMAVAVDGASSLAAPAATRIWALPSSAGERVVDYEVAPDGSRFLVILERQSPLTAPRLIVVRNWIEELRARFMPTR
jgi:serine/threonine-protein kinase